MRVLSKACLSLCLIFATSNVYAVPAKKVLLGAVLGACVGSSSAATMENPSFRGYRSLQVNACPAGTTALPISCENCDFETGALDGGWETQGTAGVTSSVFGITAQSGTFYGYAEAGAQDEWNSISRTFSGLPAGATISGFVGFQDNHECPFDDQGEFIVELDLIEGPQTTTVKTWSACEEGFPIFRGWEPFQVTASVGGDVSIQVRVRNIGDSELNSAVVIDNINICAQNCNKVDQASKWYVCHNVEHKPKTICVDWEGVQDHLADHTDKSDFLGVCD